LGGTPFLMINGLYYNGPMDYGSLNSIIQLMLLEPKQYRECPDFTLDLDKTYIATIKTEKGDIVIELFDDVVQFGLELFQTLEGRQLVVWQGAQGAVF